MIVSTSLQVPQPAPGPAAAQNTPAQARQSAVRAETRVAVDPPAVNAPPSLVGDKKTAVPGRVDALPPGPTPTFQENVLQRIARTALDVQARQAQQEAAAKPRPDLPEAAADRAAMARSKPLPDVAQASDRARSLKLAPADETPVSDTDELPETAPPATDGADPLADTGVVAAPVPDPVADAIGPTATAPTSPTTGVEPAAAGFAWADTAPTASTVDRRG